MVLRGALLFLLLASALAQDEPSAFSFQHVDYFHRWSGDNQHEFTPAKQEDLDHWTDMITINTYPAVDDGEKLAEVANAVLGNYQRAGKVIRTHSVPATDESPAEHFIAVLFTRPDFAEAAFARVKLHDGKGHSFVYSHRVYGNEASEEMGAWLKANGEKTEKTLMDWEPPGKVKWESKK
ncbi:MAG: hypothetical protein ABR611_13165 [Chthoniobacterales bacterium]